MQEPESNSGATGPGGPSPWPHHACLVTDRHVHVWHAAQGQ